MAGDTMDTILRRPHEDRGIFLAGKYLEDRHVTPKDIAAVLNDYAGDVYSVTGGVIVSNRPYSTAAADWLATNGSRSNVRFVMWRGPEDDEPLVTAIGDALGGTGSDS